MAIQWIGVCVAAAMACALLRVQRPELATVVSLAVGAAVLVMLTTQFKAALPRLDALRDMLARVDGDALTAILRCAGITVLSELGIQLCLDAGERALAGRIGLIARVAILALCLPMAERLVSLLWRLAP